jgi:hypothetical protein
MDELNLISASVKLNNIFLKLKLSLEEIQQKHGHRTDLINSMERTIIDLMEVKATYSTLEKEFRSAVSSQYRLEHQNMDLKFRIKDLESQLKFKNIEL